MNRSDVREFHYIARYENIRSILDRGILSYLKARPYKPVSFAMDSAQARRDMKVVADGRTVHTYANVYFDAHNPTLSARRNQNLDLVVLRVDPAILDLPGTHIATQNAASDGVRFLPSPDGLVELDAALVYAEYWTDHDPVVRANWGRTKCAEVLVPDSISTSYITGAYAWSDAAAERLAVVAHGFPIQIHRELYF